MHATPDLRASPARTVALPSHCRARPNTPPPDGRPSTSGMTASCGYSRGEDDHVCLICLGHRVESPAGDDPQARVRDVAVDELGRELSLGVGGDSIDGEDAVSYTP